MNFVEVTWSYILVPNMCHFQRLIEQIFNFKVWRRTRFQMEDGVDTSWKQILFTPPLHTLFLSFIPSFNLPPLITAPFLCVFFVVLFSAPFLLLPFFFFWWIFDFAASQLTSNGLGETGNVFSTPANWFNAFSITFETNKATATFPSLPENVTCDLRCLLRCVSNWTHCLFRLTYRPL